jgi:hypothetical protein
MQGKRIAEGDLFLFVSPRLSVSAPIVLPITLEKNEVSVMIPV